MSWVSIINNFFLKCTETEARFYLRVLSIVLYEKFLSNFMIPFFVFPSGLLIDQGNFSADLSASKLCESVNWMNCMNHITYLRNVSINLYLRPCSIAIYVKLYLYCLSHFRLFFWFVNCKNLFYNLCIAFWKCQDTHCLYWSVFSTEINRKIIFNCLLLLKQVLLVSRLCELSQGVPEFFLLCLETKARFTIEGF